MFSGDLKELILKLIEERKEPKLYSLLRNEEAWNQEYYIIDTEHVHGLESYYPQKKFEYVMEQASLSEVMQVLESKNMDYNDVLFLDRILLEDYALVMTYFQKFTTLGSIVKNSASDSALEKKEKAVKEEVQTKIQESENGASFLLPLWEQFFLSLSKDMEEIKKQCEEKGLQVQS